MTERSTLKIVVLTVVITAFGGIGGGLLAGAIITGTGKTVAELLINSDTIGATLGAIITIAGVHFVSQVTEANRTRRVFLAQIDALRGLLTKFRQTTPTSKEQLYFEFNRQREDFRNVMNTLPFDKPQARAEAWAIENDVLKHVCDLGDAAEAAPAARSEAIAAAQPALDPFIARLGALRGLI